MKHSSAEEQALMTELWRPEISDDLLNFVLFVYPWGKEGTPLAQADGPRQWQRDYLNARSDHIREQRLRMEKGMRPSLWRHATASGRGPGKSSLVAWLEHNAMSCRIGGTVIITANTEPQLKSRTFAEIRKWLTLAINGHWFETSVLSVYPAPWFKQLIESQLKIDCGYYYAQGQLWSEENPDAFAGAHNPLGMSVIMDEASGIPTPIFDVAEGFFTEPELYRFWDVFSNPRRGSGAFYDCFHRRDASGKLFWKTRQIDSRTVEGLDKELFDQQIAKNGIDSYTVRVEVLGQFPRQGDRQFIGSDAVFEAQQREEGYHDSGAPLVMGLDVARFGDDWNVARFRRGNDARSIPAIQWQGIDLYTTAERAAALINEFNPDAVCIDAGMGSGVIDILTRKNFRVHEVHFGGGADDKQWANKGTEMYARIRQWLPGAWIDGSEKLFGDLTGREFDYHGKAKDQIILEPKEKFKARMGRSPDDGDALALTFAVKVARKDLPVSRRRRVRVAEGLDESVFT